MTTTAAPGPSAMRLRPTVHWQLGTVPSENDRAGRGLSALILVVASLVAAGLLWSRADYVPMWDGRIYADCVIDAAARPFRLDAYRCADHVSHAYVAILALAQRIAPTSPAPMLVANALLFAVAAAAMWRILGRLFPDPSHATGRALTTAAFLVHPVVLAGLVQPGLDFGVLVFSLCAVAALLEVRIGALAAAGSLLVFSKEPGLLIYGILAAFAVWRAALPEAARWPAARAVLLGAAAFVLAYNAAPWHPAVLPAAALVALGAVVIARPRGLADQISTRNVVRRLLALWPLALPVLLFAAYAAYRIGAHPSPSDAAAAGATHAGAGARVLWGGGSARMLAHMFLRLEVDAFARSALALTFVVGFLWLPSALVAADLAVGAVRAAMRRPARALAGARPELVTLTLALTAALVWALTRYVTYSNARYYLPVYPLLLVATLCALVRLGVPRRVREAALLGIAGLLAVSAVRTIDPVSRRLWGTFAVGDRALLRVTALTGECCGYGRDQLAYNLEFTRLADLQDALYARMQPTPKTVLVVHDQAEWHTVGPLDAHTGRRTLGRDGTIRPPLAPASFLVRPDIRVADGWAAWYLAFPYVDNGPTLAALRGRYDVGPAHVVTAPGGYAMAAHQLRERLRPPAPVSPR